MFSTSLRKKRAVGIVFLVVILSLFVSLNRFPKLDTVRADLDAVTSPQVECFQGFCIEKESDSSFLSSWWSFSVTYLRLVTVGMIFAFAVAGLTEAMLFPRSGGVAVVRGSPTSRILKGLAIGPVMNLCSACIVPVSAAFRRRGAGVEGALAILHGSSVLNVPALVMAALVFTPMLGVSRFVLGMVAALLVGPLVARVMGRGEGDPYEKPETVAGLEGPENSPWGQVLKEAFRDWGRSSLEFVVRIGPIMVVAGFASGLAIQWISPETIDMYLGNDLRGVLIAGTLGILINVPLLFEIPLVALLVLLGMGAAPAATLLFTAAAGGPLTFWGLATVMPKRAIATLATATWGLGVLGGLGILGYGLLTTEDGATLRLGTVEAAMTPGDTAHVLGSPIFTDVTASAGVDFLHHEPGSQLFPLGGGVVVFDYNGDGLQDIFIPDMRHPNVLYRNNGDGTFTDVAVAAGVDDPDGEGNGGCAADYDNDGDQDLYVTIHGSNKLFRNNGDGTFTDVSASSIEGYDAKRRFTGCAWGDYDRDGYLDLIVLSHMGEAVEDVLKTGDYYLALRGLSLFHNNGEGYFADVTSLLGDTSGPIPGGAVGDIYGAGFQPGWVDIDNDGDLDLYVVNDFGQEIQPNVLWRNDGPGTEGTWRFVDISESSRALVMMDGMGLAVGDYNLDGNLDLFMTNINRNVLLNNRGSGLGFVKAAAEAGTQIGLIQRRPRISWGATFFDYDNDGDEDLYVVSGFLAANQPVNLREQPNALLRNEADGTFLDVSDGSGADDPGIGRGGAYLDFNNDGCLDLFVVNYGQRARLFQNTCESGNNWLVINLEGASSNRDGVGARITVVAGGTSQIREMAAGSSQMGQNMLDAHFGLGSATIADSVTVRWPSGKVQTIANVPLNQRLTITEPD